MSRDKTNKLPFAKAYIVGRYDYAMFYLEDTIYRHRSYVGTSSWYHDEYGSFMDPDVTGDRYDEYGTKDLRNIAASHRIARFMRRWVRRTVEQIRRLAMPYKRIRRYHRGAILYR